MKDRTQEFEISHTYRPPSPEEAIEKSVQDWIPVSKALPPLDEPVWLYEHRPTLGGFIYVGLRAEDDEGWQWANCYDGAYWEDLGKKWETDTAEADDDYKPTHWPRLPRPPHT